MLSTLSQKFFNGIQWQGYYVILHSILHILAIMILGRLLNPIDFGIIAIANVIASFTILISETGFRHLIIQKKKIDENLISNSFYLSFLLSLLLYVILLFGKKQLSIVFGIEELNDVIPVLSITIVIVSLSSISTGLLEREIRFKEISIINILSYFFGYFLPVILFAINGFGFWSVIYALVIQKSIFSLLILIRKKVTFKPFGNSKYLFKLFLSGAYFSLSKFISFINNNIDYLIISRMLDTYKLGIYERSFKIMSTPVQLVSRVIDKVTFPIFSKFQNEKDKVDNIFISIFYISILILLPVSIIIHFNSKILVFIMLGKGWEEIEPLLGVLAFAIPFKIVAIYIENIFKAVGDIKIEIRLRLVYLALLVILLITFINIFGLIGAGYAYTITIGIHCVLLLLIYIYKYSIGANRYRYILSSIAKLLVIIYPSLLGLEYLYLRVDIPGGATLKLFISTILIIVFVYVLVGKFGLKKIKHDLERNLN